MRIPLAALLLTQVAHAAPATPAETAAANAVVKVWLAAQNGGDFATYQDLYSPAFSGVKRVGTTAKTMDRAAWLADRKTMFRSPMKVAAAAIDVTTDGGRVVVELDQTWEQGTFADTGRKRLALDRTAALANQPRAILAEEMLSSRVVLNRAACVRAVHPEDPPAARREDVSIVDLGDDRFVCSVATASDGRVDVVVAALGRGKKGWTELGRIDLDYVAESNDEGGKEGKVELGLIQLGPKASAVLVEHTRSENGPEYSAGKTASTLYRVTPSGFDELVDFETVWSNGEADEGTRCELEVKAKQVKGHADLDVVCLHTTGDYHGPEGEKHTEERSVTRYRWDGTDYKER